MCVAAFSAYVGFPSYYLPVFLLLLSILLWWRASFLERKDAAEPPAKNENSSFQTGATFGRGWRSRREYQSRFFTAL